MNELDQMIQDVKRHHCTEKVDLVTWDGPRHLRLGYKCASCGDQWSAHLTSFADSEWRKNEVFRELMTSPQGRELVGMLLARE